MSTWVAASTAKLYWEVAEQYGIARGELLTAAGLTALALNDPNALIPRDATDALLRALIQRADDPALGLRIARTFDLRTMGFWGYALLSSLTLRQRMQLHLRYYRLHHPSGEVSFRVEGQRAIADFVIPKIPDDIMPVVMDFNVAISCIQLSKHMQDPRPPIELWLTYPERPHHQQLRALTRGLVVFNAPHFRIAFPAKELDRRLSGDPHLLELARAQLEAQLAKLTMLLRGDVLAEVRERLIARLSNDASLENVAADLRVSARTLRRRLSKVGSSFQDLLDEVRRAHAISFLVDTNQAIERVAGYLGYRDPANFRRAFRRWTGAAPAAFRARHRKAS